MMFQRSKSDRMDFVQENKCEEQSSRESVSGSTCKSDLESTCKSDLESTCKSDLESTCKSDLESTCKSDLESNEGHEEKGRKILTRHINRLAFSLSLSLSLSFGNINK